MVTFDSVSLGSVATYTCNQAYNLSGPATRTCVRIGANTVWSGQAPTCERKNAQEKKQTRKQSLTHAYNYLIFFPPSSLPYMFVKYNDIKSHAYVATTPPSHSCTHTVILCPQLLLVNGMIIMTSNTVGSQAFHQCNPGFSLSGLSIRECTNSGQWSGAEPTCTRKLI